jgi:hypothetical protein
MPDAKPNRKDHLMATSKKSDTPAVRAGDVPLSVSAFKGKACILNDLPSAGPAATADVAILACVVASPKPTRDQAALFASKAVRNAIRSRVAMMARTGGNGGDVVVKAMSGSRVKGEAVITLDINA